MSAREKNFNAQIDRVFWRMACDWLAGNSFSRVCSKPCALGFPTSAPSRSSETKRHGLGKEFHRCVHSRQPRRKEACARSSCQEIHTPAPGVFRFDRAATITGGDRSICEGQSPESLGGI